MRRKFLGEENLAVAASHHNLALILRDQGKLPEAEVSFREALAMERKLVGNEHPNVAAMLQSTLDVLLRQKKSGDAAPKVGGQIDYIYEQPETQILGRLLPRYVETQILRAMLESSAAEHGARMTAMEAATQNAGEVIEALTLHMNKVRQAAITTEIIEIVSGANYGK